MTIQTCCFPESVCLALSKPVTLAGMRSLRAFLALSLALLLAACGTLPATVQRLPSSAFTGTDDTFLGKALAPELASHPGLTGILPLIDAREAFAARMALAQ